MGTEPISRTNVRLGPAVKKTESVQDWTAVAQNTIAKSEECDISEMMDAAIHIQAALDSATAHTGTRFIVQIAASEEGDEDWQDWVDFVALIGTATGAAIEDDPLAAGSTTIALTGHAFTVAGVQLFIEDSTLSNSELVLESAQSANSVSILRGTTNAHDQDSVISNIAMTQNIQLPKSAVRAQLVVDNSYDNNGSSLDYKMRVSKNTGGV